MVDNIECVFEVIFFFFDIYIYFLLIGFFLNVKTVEFKQENIGINN